MVAASEIRAKLNWFWLTALRQIEHLFRNQPAVLKLLYKTRLKSPDAPQYVGMTVFQQSSSWVLDVRSCPCDLHFVQYLKQEGIEGKSIFHFGTGVHHFVGLENQKFDRPNEILGITASAIEHRSYTNFVLKDNSLAKHYKVLFSDIYLLTANTIPMFDIVTLFHLCEFYLPENADSLHQTDETLVQLLLDKLNPEGRILFYTGSLGFYQTAPILEKFVNQGKLKLIGKYEKLLIYARA